MTVLDAVVEAVRSLSALERGLVSMLVVGAIYTGWQAVHRAAALARERLSDRVVDVALTAFAVVLLGVAAEALLVVWSGAFLPDTLVEVAIANKKLVLRLGLTAALFVGTYVLTGAIHRTVDEFVANRENLTAHQAEVTYRVLQICLYLAITLVVLKVWAVNLSGLLIGAGFAGIVLGMAARQTLGAVLAGFVLMFARPFEIGDWVKIGDNDGIVTDITIVNTRIQTFDGEYVMLPNDYVGSEEIVNRSRKGRLRLHVEVGVDYTSDVDHAMEVAEETLKDVDEILTVPQPQVVLKEFGDSAVVLDLRFWIDKPSARRKWRAQTAVISRIHEAFAEEGITIPFPQRELSSRAGEDRGARVPDDYGANGEDADE